MFKRSTRGASDVPPVHQAGGSAGLRLVPAAVTPPDQRLAGGAAAAAAGRAE